MVGLSQDADPIAAASTLEQSRRRAGWLLATIAGGILASEIIGTYQATLSKVAILAGFIPVVMGMGGNVGMQAATLAVRGLATGQVQLGGSLSFVWRQSRVGLVLGVSFGVILGVYGWLRFPAQPLVGASIGLSVATSMCGASVLGGGVPVVLARFGVDPAIATGPMVTMMVDLLGIVVYFNIARALLGL
jgi:magnesium transporter